MQSAKIETQLRHEIGEGGEDRKLVRSYAPEHDFDYHGPTNAHVWEWIVFLKITNFFSFFKSSLGSCK